MIFASGTSGIGRNALFYSIDSGKNWQQLNDYYTDAADLFIGSEYLFISGLNALWRMPKSAIPAKVTQSKNISSISITDCFPNPATSSTRMTYSLPIHSDVQLEAFDVMGRKIATLASGARDAGANEVVWDTKLLPTGSYIIRLNVNGESVSKVVEVVR